MCSSPARPPVWPWRRVAPVSPCNTEPRRLGPGSMSQRAGPLAAGRAIHPAERDEGGRAGAPHRRAARHAAAAARCRACAAARRPPARAGARSWPPRGCAAARTRAPARARGRGLRHALILSCGRPGKRAWQPREWPARAHARTGQAGASLCLQAARSSTPSGGWQPPRPTAHSAQSRPYSDPPRPGRRPRPRRRASHSAVVAAAGQVSNCGPSPSQPWRPRPLMVRAPAHLPVSLGGRKVALCAQQLGRGACLQRALAVGLGLGGRAAGAVELARLAQLQQRERLAARAAASLLRRACARAAGVIPVVPSGGRSRGPGARSRFAPRAQE